MTYHKHQNRLIKSSNTLAFKFLKRAIQMLLCPLDYTRTREIPILLSLIDKHFEMPDARVADLASPQILSCHLARTHPSWKITYINSFDREISDLEVKKTMLGLSNLTTRKYDIRRADAFEPCSLDMAVSCSVFEHIADRDGQNGDSIAAQNVATWLKRGGIFFLSVPFHKKAFDEYKDQPVYKDKYQKNGLYFFQRFYDLQTLNSRIIQPSGLKLKNLVYTGERFYYENEIKKRTSMVFASRRKRIFLGRLFSLLSDVFFVQSEDHLSLRKPYLAYVVLKK